MPEQLPFRIGTGFDVHRFAENRKLMLGGVEIPFELGLEGHSDADALLHAICDAMLGAVATGDIGHHFPNTDPKWKDRASMDFVVECARIVAAKGYSVGNVDSMILAERPKIAPYVEAMRQQISGALGIGMDCVSVKATTMERMGAIGRVEGIAAMATVLLIRSS